ncbi:MAG: hypothetical protein Q4A32_01530 [Lachnospiraceae bacterium]|nr:hypothetical protein [Lachnospiraceae bacterium]
MEIGADVPRSDYVIIRDDGTDIFEESIFSIFRKFNILEYKNPYDSLNERTIHKIAGYANLLIGTAEHEGDVPSDQVAMSIFRYMKNPDTFDEIRSKSKIMKDALMELMKEDIDEKVRDAVMEKEQEYNISAIRNIMETLGLTMDNAMNALKIPPAQQATYANLVSKMS